MGWFNNQNFWEEAAERGNPLNIAHAQVKDTVQKLNINVQSQYIKQIAARCLFCKILTINNRRIKRQKGWDMSWEKNRQSAVNGMSGLPLGTQSARKAGSVSTNAINPLSWMTYELKPEHLEVCGTQMTKEAIRCNPASVKSRRETAAVQEAIN